MEVTDCIPQRAPFLFVDSIVDRSESAITTIKHISGQEDFFKGHFPDLPIMPGVLLCEALFQTGAILMSHLTSESHKIGVVTRIDSTRFKKIVVPGDTLEMSVQLVEQIGSAYFMKGITRIKGKIAVMCEFSCTLIDRPRGEHIAII